MLWMCIGMSPHQIIAVLVGQAFGIFPDYCLPPAGQTKAWCGTRGYRPIRVGSNIIIRHVYNVS
jgi:hypothetical protein